MYGAMCLLLLAVPVLVVGGNVYHVIPHEYAVCPRNITCHSLQYYVDRQDTYFVSNTTFYLRDGTHRLRSYQSILVSHIDGLAIVGLGEIEPGLHEIVMQSSVVIRCATPTVSIAFMHSSNITINRVTISNCGYIFYEPFYFKYLRSAISITSSLIGGVFNISIVAIEVHDMHMHQVSIQNCSGFGLVAINVFGLTIADSSFSQNNLHTYYQGCPVLYCCGGNIVIRYTIPYTCLPRPVIYAANITQTNVSFGINLYNMVVNQGGGIAVHMEQPGLYGVDVILDNLVLYGNTAFLGANLAIETTRTLVYYAVKINNIISSHGNRIYSAKQDMGSGLMIVTDVVTALIPVDCGYTQLPYNSHPITITNSVFSNNAHGTHKTSSDSVILVNHKLGSFINQEIWLENITIVDTIGVALAINGLDVPVGIPATLVCKNVLVANISCKKCENHGSAHAILLTEVYNITFQGLTVVDNNVGGMIAVDTSVTMTGYNTFRNNTAYVGGAIALSGSSTLVMKQPTLLELVGNHASKYGGAIFVDQSGTDVTMCFFEAFSVTRNTTNILSISSINNTANVAGSFLYGGNVDECSQKANNFNFWNFPNSTATFNGMFHYTTTNSTVSAISSDAARVCFCIDGLPDCSILNTQLSTYPGDEVVLNTVTVGQRNGTTQGTIIVYEVIKNQFSSRLYLWNQVCSNLIYHINAYSDHNTTILYIAANIKSKANVPLSLMINITAEVSILDCPPGFVLSQELGSCVCDEVVHAVSSNATCSVSTQTITKLDNTWLGYNNEHQCILATENCPFDYCNSIDRVTFKISEPDSQCASDRSGYLCGKCIEGTSLVLGANSCHACSNDYVALVIVFAVAGVLLVAVLLILNLTVAVGSLNGLIFFANVVKLNETVYFPRGPVYVVSQFISWINLDWGIETCFYNGMDGYAKIWLQFVFPYYILILTMMVIFIARYSGRFSRIIGNNTIKVLATLILLSYTKLIRTIMLVLSHQGIICEDSFTLSTWKVDPNIVYFSPKHSILFLHAMVVLVLFLLPFTMILLLNPLIQPSLKRYEWFKKRWLKLKPFLDAYNGPYKDKFGPWTGVLLLMRIVLLFVASFAISPSIVLAGVISVVAVILSLFAVLGGVYKKRGLNIMETLFLMLLLIMSAMVCGGHGYIGTIVCVTLCIISSMTIVGIHGISKIHQRRCVRHHSPSPRHMYVFELKR